MHRILEHIHYIKRYRIEYYNDIGLVIQLDINACARPRRRLEQAFASLMSGRTIDMLSNLQFIDGSLFLEPDLFVFRGVHPKGQQSQVFAMNNQLLQPALCEGVQMVSC